ncbi:unnamed protein product [Orchesella dallaii]|uniref:Uncharacterized protein n=1 Tax=Orchesella dallaii TaxID=48710 RepID=A0ABP1RSJ2_9HEXA
MMSENIQEGGEEKVEDPVILGFKRIAENLEKRYRKYEEISRFSRDITWESKRTISLILGYTCDKSVLKKAENRLRFITTNEKCFQGLATALQPQDKYLFLRAYTGGVQEFVEAVALYNFFKHRKILTYEDLLSQLTFEVTVDDTPESQAETKETLPNAENDSSEIVTEKNDKKRTVKFALVVPKTDFFLGLSDVTGELMRACGSSVKTPDFKTFLFESCAFVRVLHQNLSCISPYPRGLSNKLGTMKANLCKLEMACYHYVVDRYVCSMNFRFTRFSNDDYIEGDDSGFE